MAQAGNRTVRGAIVSVCVEGVCVYVEHLVVGMLDLAFCSVFVGKNTVLTNRAINQKVAGSIPWACQMTLCPWARHFTLLASGECSCTYCKSFG